MIKGNRQRNCLTDFFCYLNTFHMDSPGYSEPLEKERIHLKAGILVQRHTEKMRDLFCLEQRWKIPKLQSKGCLQGCTNPIGSCLSIFKKQPQNPEGIPRGFSSHILFSCVIIVNLVKWGNLSKRFQHYLFLVLPEWFTLIVQENQCKNTGL